MTIRRNAAFRDFAGAVAAALAMCICTGSQGQAARGPVDPGVRGGAPGAGTPLEGLTADETAFFHSRLAKFADLHPLTGTGGNPNIILRIPTPVFGAGLIEAIPDSAILANMKAQAHLKRPLGIFGHPNAHLSGNANRSANDGTITRFGWKAQNKSLLLFSGEAYNVEMGVTSQLFPQERDETPGCVFNATPEDTVNFTPTSRTTSKPHTAVLSDI